MLSASKFASNLIGIICFFDFFFVGAFVVLNSFNNICCLAYALLNATLPELGTIPRSVRYFKSVLTLFKADSKLVGFDVVGTIVVSTIVVGTTFTVVAPTVVGAIHGTVFVVGANVVGAIVVGGGGNVTPNSDINDFCNAAALLYAALLEPGPNPSPVKYFILSFAFCNSANPSSLDLVTPNCAINLCFSSVKALTSALLEGTHPNL